LNQIFQHKATFFHGGPVHSTDNGFLEIVPIKHARHFFIPILAYEIIPVVAHGLDARTNLATVWQGKKSRPPNRALAQ